MAANKLHLKNVDKDYKLKKTDKVTSAGRPVYINTKTGKEHSEISVTLEMPEGSGNWINVPSLINGRVYNLQGVIDMLRAGKIEPNSTGHATQEIAVEAAKARSASLQPNIGQTLKPANNVDDYDPAKAAFVNENMGTFASTFPTIEENPNGLYRVPTNLEEQLDQQILGTDTASMEETVANNNNLRQLAAIMDRTEAEKDDSNNNVNLVRSQTERIAAQESQAELDAKAANERASLERMYQIMDRAQSEKDDSYFYNPDDPSLNTPAKHIAAKYRFDNLLNPLEWKGLKRAENPTMNRYTQTPVSESDQAMFDNAKEERRLVHMGKAMSSYGPRFTPEMDTGTRTKPSKTDIRSSGPERRQSNSRQPDTIMSDGSSIRGRKRKKPIFSFNMSPDQKMNDNRSLKGLTPEYGEMPGFKKAKDGNYWSADETSPFWQTDAGYEKAMQTWGEKPGWVKPNYRPKKQELDIDAIKKWFKPNK